VQAAYVAWASPDPAWGASWRTYAGQQIVCDRRYHGRV